MFGKPSTFRPFSAIFRKAVKKKLAIYVFFFVEYLHEDGRERSKYVAGLTHFVYYCA